MGNLHDKINFNLVKTNEVFCHSPKRHPKIGKILTDKFDCEMSHSKEI